jgi:hypothetical protein
MSAPLGAEVVAIERSQTKGGDPAIRITTDESAPLYRAVDWDETHPYRQTELIPKVLERLPAGVTFNSHDVTCIKRSHNINETNRPEFVHRPRFGWYQYSDAFVAWIAEQYRRDQDFFAKARDRYYKLTH